MSRVEEVMRRAAGRTAAPVEAGAEVFESYPPEIAGRSSRSTPLSRRETLPAPIAAPRPSGAHDLTKLGAAAEGKVVVDAEISPASVEEYRRLAAGLHLRQAESTLRTLMVSSAMPHDGKTLTSTNLALTLSESYKRSVLLIDADLRRPSIHELFRLPNQTGLSDGLHAPIGTHLPVVEVSPRLTVLPAGRPDANPMASLTSDRMAAILSESAARFDWVIVDTPPVGVLSDAHLLAALMDGVLLVIGAGSTPFPAIKRAVMTLGADRIVGVVLNRVIAERTRYAYYDYYGYSAQRSS